VGRTAPHPESETNQKENQMLPLPNSYPHNNTYRMVHFVQKEPSEMERITETLADALAAGRNHI
jgi:hypothetical protein